MVPEGQFEIIYTNSWKANSIDRFKGTRLDACEPKVPTIQAVRMTTTLRSYFHRTIARHAQTMSLMMG